MAITAFTGWSATAALNVDLNSIPLASASMTANQVDDAFREMMAQFMSLLIALGLFVVGCLWVLGVFHRIVETVL